MVGGLESRALDTCFGPPTLREKLASMRAVPIVICTEDGNCYFGQIMEVCADYITLNWYGTLLSIPINQITRAALAPFGVDGFSRRL